MWVSRGVNRLAGAWPSTPLALQSLFGMGMPRELVSKTWTITREVTAHIHTPPPRGSSQQVFFQFLLTFLPGSVPFVFLLAMAIDDGVVKCIIGQPLL